MKGARATEIILDEDGSRLMTLSRIADTLGLPRSTVHSWASNREASGFPAPARTGVAITGHDDADLYDLDEVRVWHLFEYDPSLRGVAKRVRSDDPDRGGPAVIGRLLGVRTKRVSNWIARRANTRCPEPGPDGLYDLREWQEWFPRYAAAVAAKEHLRAQPASDRGTPAVVGRALGVDTRWVCVWIARRDSTGCPEPGEDGRYSLAEWRAWHDNWVRRPSVQRAQKRGQAA